VTESIIMMAFLLLMIFGLIHLCMLMSMKFMVDHAAFAAARTAMISPGDVNEAALEGMGYMRGWWKGSRAGLNQPYVQGPIPKTIRGKTRTGYSATWAAPFGFPAFVDPTPCGSSNSQTCGVRLIGFAPYTSQPDIPEEGDNQ
jgi:hypothetical protein